MKTTKYILTLALALVCTWSSSFAIDQTYYNSIDGKSGTTLRDALYTITSAGPKNMNYDKLWTAYKTTDVYPADHAKAGKIWDMYGGCTFTYSSDQCGNYDNVCDCYNREHSLPKSWFNDKTPAYYDMGHIVPTDGKVNGMRSNYAFGEVNGGTTWGTGKLGNAKAVTTTNVKGSSTITTSYKSTVFEPADEYKGDFARMYMYMIVRYKYGNSNSISFTSTSDGQLMFNNTDANYGLTDYSIALLMKWHRQDPVSEKEINRNNGMETVQGNRNPFIDYPCLAEYLWGNKAGETVTLSQLVGTFSGSWTTGDGCPCGDVPTITLPAGDVFVGSTEAGTPVSKTIMVQGVNLTSGLSFAISGTNSSLFSLSANTMTQANATSGSSLTITYSPSSAGDHTATLTISGGGLASNYEIELSGTCCSPYVITLSRNGITETIGACGTYTLPTAEDEGETCDGWEFAGWITGSTPFEENQTTEPSFVEEVNSATTVYAIYSKTTGGSSAPKRAKMADTWTRVTSMETLTGGGTFIMGYEATAKSGTIIPLRSKDCNATTSTNGYFYTGTTAESSTSGTLDMTKTITSTDYEVYISSPTSGKINIQMVSSTGNYYGASSGGSSKNTGRLYAAGNSNETNLTVEWDSETNNTFKLSANVTGSYKYLKYNTGSPRFAFYNSAGGQVVFYKKESGGGGGSDPTTNYKKLPCTTYLISYADADGIAAGGNYSANVTSALAGTTITLDYDEAEHYTFDSWTVTNTSTSETIAVTNSQFTMPEADVTIQANFTATCTGTLPTPSVTATPGDGQITLTWEDVAGANSYTVVLGTGVGYTTECSSPSIGDITHAGTTNTCVISGLVNGLSYTASVLAHSATVCEGEAGDATATPGEEVCLNKVNISKGTPSNGSFNLDKMGEQENCADGGLVVHVTDITPASGYQFLEIMQSGIASGVTIDNDAKTVTYAKDVAGTSTINVVFEALPTYEIKFYNMGVQVGETQNLYVGQTAVKPSDPTACTGYTFVGWWTETLAEDNTTAETWVTDFTVSEAGNKNYYAVYSKTDGGGSSSNVTDELTRETTGITSGSTTYSNWSGKAGTSGAVYAGYSAGGNNAIQLRSNNNNSGIITTTSGGNATKVTVTWQSNTTSGRTIDIYGKSSAYSAATELYSTSTQGTKIGSIVYGTSTELTISDEYGYIGIRSKDGALYLSSVSITWSSGSSTTYYTTAPDCPTPCTNEITITKGDYPENGTFVLSNSGTVCIDEGNASTTVTATPNEHYHLATVTSTSGSVGTISGNECTITGINASTTINVTFAADPKEVVNWYVAGTPTEEEKYAGETLVGIPNPDGDAICDGKTFVGWTATADYSSETDAPDDLFNDPTTKTMPTGGTNYYAVFADGTTSGGPSNLIEYDGSGIVTLEEIDGVSQNSVSTYAAGNAPYLLKFDGDGDYIQFNLTSVPATLSFNYKMIGGGNTSTMTIKECATADGSYTDVQALTISGAQNSTGTLTTTTSFTKKYVRMVFTKGSNVGVGAITITGTGGGATYSNYSTSCVECTNKVTLTKGTESNGSFTLDKADGEHNNCDADFVVTVSDITPEVGYYCTGVTATGEHVTVSGPDGSGNYIVTYSHGYSITSIVTANFAASPTFTASFMNCGTAYGSAQTTYAGNNITAPSGTPEACEGYTFVGWVAAAQTSETTVLPEVVTFPQPMPVGGITYYALYRRIEGGSGSTNVVLNTSAQYTNGQAADIKEIDGVTFAFDMAGGSNAPTYYSTGTSVRMYADNTLTISSAFTISAIEFTWGDRIDAGLVASEGEYNADSDGGLWSGSTTSVTFEAGSSGQQRIQTITVTIDGGGTPYYTTSPSCSGYIITVTEVSQGEAASDKSRCDEGGTVTITLTADEGYECGGITTSPVVSTTQMAECTYTFSMPDADIIVTPVFTPKIPRTFTFEKGTGICATSTLTEAVWNGGVTLPTATANSGCDPEYVFAGWATSAVTVETEVRPTLYAAGTLYNGEETTLYAVYSQTTGGSASGFTLSYTIDDVTYYAAARTGTNKYMGATTDVADAARFTIVTSNDKQYLCWHGENDTYVSNNSNKTDLLFTTNIENAYSWDITETGNTIALAASSGRHFMFNTNIAQRDRFAAYSTDDVLVKGDAGTTVYNSIPSCVCYSVDISYNANGGTLAEGCENVTEGECERDWLLCDAPTRDGYLFTNWKDQNGTLYDAGAVVTDLKISLTLTAQWIPAPYTVLFNAGSGSCVESLTESSRGDGIILPKAEPSPACADDWTFIGWSETELVGETNTSATIIGVAGTPYTPASNNVTLYAVYSSLDEGGATPDYTRVTDDTPAEGDYAIVVAQSDESFGLLTYGTIAKGRLEYTKDYTSLPVTTISSPEAEQIWHLTYDASGYAYLYNANAGAYLAASGSNIDYNASAGSAFVLTKDPSTYGDYECLNSTASGSTNYYLGANKDADYIRYYGSTTLIALNSVTLYKGSIGTRYYATSPVCMACEDPEWSFELGTSVVKTKGSEPFTNTVIKGHESSGTVTYSSTNEAVATVDAAGLVTMHETGTTTITLRLSKAMPYCATVLQYELEVKEPSIDIVGVTEDGKITIEHDLEGTITIDLSEGNTVSTGTAANDLFFSKYFEAASNMKLFAIFNGTGHEMDISDIRVRCNCSTAGSGAWPTSTGSLGYVELRTISKLREQYPKLKIPSGTELIFWSNNKGSTSSTAARNTELRECITFTIGEMEYHYSDMEAMEIPNWFCLGNYTSYNSTDADGNNQFVFDGDDSMIMERYNPATGQWEAIDIFGAGTSAAPASTAGLVEKITTNYEINGSSQPLNDDDGFHAECAGNPIPLSTNRYMLVRKNTVLDGMHAVESNTTSFATLCEEWDGTPVGGSADGYCRSGNVFSDIAEYDYAENYIDWTGINDDAYTVTENADGTVSVYFNTPLDLDARACSLLKIEVHDKDDDTKILATTEYKIPIVVKAGTHMTTDDLFKNQGEKCATCDVAILGSATLTKATDGAANDMPEVRDIYVYGGGQLVIPSGTHYRAHDLIMRMEMAADKVNVAVPDIRAVGSLTNQYGGAIRQQVRVGTSRFYQFAVPYPVRLEDVTFSDGRPAVYGEDFMIRYYDGESRAQNLGTASNWKNFEGTELQPGVGYTLAVAKKAGHEQRELIFPMADASLEEGEPATKTTAIHAWGDNTIRANHRGWNFLSNPYLTTYGEDNLYGDASSMLTTGQLVPDPEHPGWWVNNSDAIPYVTLINGTRTDYSQELVSLQELPPFTTFFIQAGDDDHNSGEEFSLTFNRDHRATSAPAYMRAEQKAPVARFGVLLNGNNATDNCGMAIGEDYSAAYDMQADLSKEFGSAYSLKLYTLQEDAMRMAFLATHPDSLNKPIPLGVRLPANAEYTFSIDRRYNLGAFAHIYLTDNITGQHTDLLEDTYSFSCAKQQNDTRFCLFVVVKKDTPTGTDNLLNGIYAVGREGSVMLTGLPETADIYIYDMNGRLVLNRHTHGATSVTYHMPIGVYQIRIHSEGANALLRTIVH